MSHRRYRAWSRRIARTLRCGPHERRTGPVDGSGQRGAAPGVRFCTLADARYFLGLVALVNSLRLLGHREPITVTDIGLTDDQRRALEPECEIVSAPPGVARHPWLFAPTACLAAPAEIVVYLDADIVVTRPLHDLIERARLGGIVVFPDALPGRWFAEWEQVFELTAPLRKQQYVNSGCFLVSTRRFPQLLPRWAEACERIVGHPTATDDPYAIDTPTGFADQDALNALLMSEYPAVVLDRQPAGTEVHRPDLRSVEVRDVRTLECRLAGQPVTVLHHWGSPKPWESPSSDDFVNAYTTCLLRLLHGDDVAVRIDRGDVPRWLRSGPTGVFARRRARQATRSRRGQEPTAKR
jgi:hypothetical protein